MADSVVNIGTIQQYIVDYLKEVMTDYRIELYPDDDTDLNDKVKGAVPCLLVRYIGSPNITNNQRRKENGLLFKRLFFEPLLFEIHIGNKSLNNKAGTNNTINLLRGYLTNLNITDVDPLAIESIGTPIRDENIWWQTLTYSTMAILEVDYHDYPGVA